MSEAPTSNDLAAKAVDGAALSTAPAIEPRSVDPQATPRATGAAGRRAAAKAQSAIDKTADRLASGVTIIGAKAERAADRAAAGVRKVSDRVDPFVTERPYASLGIGVAVGLVLGLLIAPRPRIIYVKPRG